MGLFDWITGAERSVLVQVAFTDLQEMLRIGDEMFGAACGHLLDNEILDTDLDVRDDEVDEREAHLRSAILAYVSSSPGRSPVNALRILAIVQEAERIGDLAKTIADTAALAVKPRLGVTVQPLRALRNDIQAMFALTRSCFEENDPTKAEAVLALHDERKREVKEIIRGLAESTTVSTNEAVVLALGARMLGRVSSHLANIASSVVFPFDKIRRTHVDDGSEISPD